ncbi:hypothetical protein BH18CHL2_BH18CHL2_07080 [soil metagenome]
MAAFAFAANALVSFRERGFVEPLDVPLALTFGVIAVLIWRRSRPAMVAAIFLTGIHLAAAVASGFGPIAAFWLFALLSQGRCCGSRASPAGPSHPVERGRLVGRTIHGARHGPETGWPTDRVRPVGERIAVEHIAPVIEQLRERVALRHACRMRSSRSLWDRSLAQRGGGTTLAHWCTLR